MFFIYNLIFLIYSVIYFPYLLLTGRWHRDFSQRFGFFPPSLRQALGVGPNIWVHAVSVGEVMAIEGLIQRIKMRWPKHTIVCSVTTKTGYALACKRFSDTAIVIASPLDFSWVVGAFARLIRPQIYIVAETEIWPNLFTCLHKAKVPIALVNGRISDQSYGRYVCIKGLLKGILATVSHFIMQSALDQKRIIALGADPQRVDVAGNIKFDQALAPGSNPMVELQGPLWVAGSTHPGEEAIIFSVFKQLPAHWHLLIAPRHIERCREVIDLAVQAQLNPVRFSQYGSDNSARVIVLDTIGHLQGLYAQADLVFVGKSLCVGGGHNIIEPAFFAKPIVVGPNMANFRDTVASFKAHQALVQVDDPAAFEMAIKELAGDEQKRRDLGMRAREVIDQNQGATARMMHFIERLYTHA